uniref:Uncharacterized protein n=1 Tax=Sphaerodactylus townsendi TaxID=933632 RepID=A0ACB8FPI2_9SAUR
MITFPLDLKSLEIKHMHVQVRMLISAYVPHWKAAEIKKSNSLRDSWPSSGGRDSRLPRDQDSGLVYQVERWLISMASRTLMMIVRILIFQMNPNRFVDPSKGGAILVLEAVRVVKAYTSGWALPGALALVEGWI